MKYEEVVFRAKLEIPQRINYFNKSICYERCEVWERGNQINLWTYWQGYQLKDIDEKGVDILLVGQDWGNPSLGRNKELCSQISRLQKGEDVLPYSCSVNTTDKNLIRLFKSFDCDITKKNPGLRLFFTNYSLGYRRGSETGGMSKSLMKHDTDLFNALVESINPKIIICLGRLTFEMVSGKVAKGFLQKAKEGTPIKDQYPQNPLIAVYGVSHCGARGVSNVGGIETMEAAWEKIAQEYRSNRYY